VAAPRRHTRWNAGEVASPPPPVAKRQIGSIYAMGKTKRSPASSFSPREWSAEARPRRRRIRGRAQVDGEELLWLRSLSLRLRPRMAPPSADDPPRLYTEARRQPEPRFVGGGSHTSQRRQLLLSCVRGSANFRWRLKARSRALYICARRSEESNGQGRSRGENPGLHGGDFGRSTTASTEVEEVSDVCGPYVIAIAPCTSCVCWRRQRGPTRQRVYPVRAVPTRLTAGPHAAESGSARWRSGSRRRDRKLSRKGENRPRQAQYPFFFSFFSFSFLFTFKFPF
jgi:hypothetical protein